jgi:hypothetical protein
MEIVMETKNWSAWIDLMPPAPKRLHVEGDVRVGTPTSQAALIAKVPQGINPTILLLDPEVRPHAGPEVMTWVKAQYDKVIDSGGAAPSQVEVLLNNTSIAKRPVKEVH